MIEFRKKINVVFGMFFSISIPLVFAIIPLSGEIITVVAGNGYEGAILPMQLITPLILIVGIAQMLVTQILIPLKKDKIVLKTAVVGAVFGLSLNLILVSHLSSIGTAITLLCSEFLVTFFLLFYVIRNKLLFLLFDSVKLNIFYSIPYLVIVFFVKRILSDNLQILLSSFFCCSVYFFLSQLFLVKNPIIVYYVQNYFTHKNYK